MPEAFYVTMIRDGRFVAWLAGPFTAKETAEAHVAPLKSLANRLDAWTDFDAFGVTGCRAGFTPHGVIFEPSTGYT
jgi:hypothetical protein